MNSAELLNEDDLPTGDGELHLGMGSLIGIFFGLALVCGVFMGFGYMMGHRTPGPYVSSEPLYEAPRTQAIAPKPSAEVSILAATASAPQPTPMPQSVTVAATNPPLQPSASAPALVSAPVQPSPVALPVKASAASSASTQGGTIMVQIAAVKSRPDAQALSAAVTKDGFSATVRTEPQDKLFHVQVGPFDTRDEAKIMRQKLAGAGYNAFIK